METLKRLFLAVCAIAIILLAVVMWGLRLAVANIDYFKPEIEYLLTGDEASGTVFTGLSGDMNRFNPVLGVANVSVTLPDRSQPLFVDELTVEFDFWASLRAWTPVVREMSGKLEKLELTRDPEGRWWANEFALTPTSDGASMFDISETLALVPRYLKLDLRRLILHDQVNDQQHLLERISAHINHQDSQFFVQASAALPDRLGRGILVKSVVGTQRSLIYLNTSDLQLHPVAELLGLDTRGLREGSLDGELWFNLAGHRPVAINGDIVLKNGLVQAMPDNAPLTVDFHTRFNAIHRTGEWRVTNAIERLRLNGENLRGFHSQLGVVSDEDSTLLSAWIDRLPLSNLASVAAHVLPAEWNRQIEALQIDGLARDITISIDPSVPDDLRLYTRLVGVESQPWGEIPGIENIDADLVLGQQKLTLDISGEDVSVNYPDRFRTPIELRSIKANAMIQRHGAEISLALDNLELDSPDIQARGRLWLEIDGHERPFMYIRASFNDGNGASAPQYLPLNLMPDTTFAWLDEGIRGGRVVKGDLQYHGRLRDLRVLAPQRAVEFIVDFEVEDGEVLFAPEWKPARQGNGRIVFHNVSMDIELDQVTYDQVPGARATARIANLDQPVLELDILAQTPAAAGIATWIATPVGTRFRQPIANLSDIGGQIKTAIDIDLPLTSDGGDEQVSVQVDLLDVAARADVWELDLSAANGRLLVTDKSIRARQIQARFFDEPVSIDITPDAKGKATIVKAAGNLTSSNLLRKLPDPVRAKVLGRSDWQVRLRFPEEARESDDPVVEISAASNLRNTDLQFPAPLQKKSDEAVRISADLAFSESGLNLDLRYGEGLRAIGRFDAAGENDLRLHNFDVALNVKPKSRVRKGLNVYGRLPDLALGDWLELNEELGDGKRSELQQVELKLDQLDIYDRILDGVNVEVQRSAEGYIGLVDADQIKGTFEYVKGKPLKVDLEFLRIEKLEQKTDYSGMRPGKLMNFILTSKSLEYHEMQFTDLLVEARVLGDSLYVDQFRLIRDGLLLKSDAHWEYLPADDAHRTSVSATITGKEFGEAIAGLGFGDSIRSGTIQFSGGFTWPAPLLSFDVNQMQGDAKLRLENGILNNVEPGTGRFVGLMSLSALPRRLSLDFSDVLIKGMEFDKISGSYELRKGNLFTRDTRMEGPAARIKITGRTGITDRDYDQLIRVTPKFRDVLNLGAVYIGNWGLLLLQNLFKKQIDKAVEVEYQITGSWDDPQIELLKAVDENQAELPEIER